MCSSDLEGDAEINSHLAEEERSLVEKERMAIAKHRGQEPAE